MILFKAVDYNYWVLSLRSFERRKKRKKSLLTMRKYNGCFFNQKVIRRGWCFNGRCHGFAAGANAVGVCLGCHYFKRILYLYKFIRQIYRSK